MPMETKVQRVTVATAAVATDDTNGKGQGQKLIHPRKKKAKKKAKLSQNFPDECRSGKPSKLSDEHAGNCNDSASGEYDGRRPSSGGGGGGSGSSGGGGSTTHLDGRKNEGADSGGNIHVAEERSQQEVDHKAKEHDNSSGVLRTGVDVANKKPTGSFLPWTWPSPSRTR
jgi:hypothetical protein